MGFGAPVRQWGGRPHVKLEDVFSGQSQFGAELRIFHASDMIDRTLPMIEGVEVRQVEGKGE